MKYIFVVILSFLYCLSHGQEISTVAGVAGSSGYTGNGGAGTSANLNQPWDIDVDAAGNIYFSEQANSVVRRVDAVSGVITNIFGNGTAGTGQNGEKGPDFELTYPGFIHIDQSTNMLYVCDHGASRIYKMSLLDSNVYLVAGNGTSGYSPDGNAATSASISYPMGVTKGADGLVYFIDNGNSIIRKIKTDGTLETIAGIAGTSGLLDGTLITSTFSNPFDLETDGNGNFYIVEPTEGKIRKISPSQGTVLTVAGSGTAGYNGDGLNALATQFYIPQGFAVGPDGSIYIGDNENDRVRKVDAQTQIVSTVGGTGVAGYSGDGGDPLLAQMDGPLGVHVDQYGHIYFCEIDNHIVRKIKVCKDPDVPTVQILGTTSAVSDSIFCPGEFSLSILSGDLNGATDWIWYTDSCGGTAVSAGTSIIQTLTETTEFWVRGEGSCVSEDSCRNVIINIQECIEEIPSEIINAFSPNGDAVNDLLYINEADSNAVNTVIIFNRWGDPVRRFADYDNVINVWDGKDQFGVPVGSGTYFYIFESDSVRRSRWVQVIR